jgi:hypothetical protein
LHADLVARRRLPHVARAIVGERPHGIAERADELDISFPAVGLGSKPSYLIGVGRIRRVGEYCN